MSRHRKLTRKFAGFPMFKLATSGDTFPVTSPFTTGFTGLDNDQLALDLQFATDKTLTARRGPTPVFTRGSGATFVDSDGLIKYGAENLSLYSGQLVVGTGWSANATPSVTSIVDGIGPDEKNAYEVTEIANNQSHALFNLGGTGSTSATSVVSGITYTGSIYLKKITGSVDWIQLTLGSAGFGASNYANFNISNGIIGNSLGVNVEIINAGNGWYRCSISAIATTTTTTTSNLFIAFTNNTDTTTRLLTYNGNTANKVLAAMCQFERSSTARNYIQTTTAAVYGPRFDHDPATGGCKGLLIEEARTNLSWYSGAIVNNIGWFILDASSVASGVGPDGNTSYRISETATTASHLIGNTGGGTGTGATSIVNGTTYTSSIFVKKVAGSVDWVQILLGSTGFGNTNYANFNIANGTIGNSAGLASGTSPRIEAFPNGWYRCSIAVTATATITISNAVVAFINNTNTTTRAPSYAGNTANQFLATMCQFEAGLFATSYIPTVAASAIRSADTCSISGSGFTGMWNAIEGSLSSSVVFNAPISSATGQLVVDVNDTTTANRLRYFRNPTTGISGFANTSNSTTNVSVAGAVLQPFVMQRFSAGFKLDDYAFYVNNSQVAVDNLGALLVSPTTLTIGDSSAGAVRQYTNGTISSIRYYKKRLLNAKLQALTV